MFILMEDRWYHSIEIHRFESRDDAYKYCARMNLLFGCSRFWVDHS